MNKAKETENKLVAQRYAKALLELVDEKNLSKDKILSEITDVVESVNLSGDLKQVMQSPVISDTEKKDIIMKVFKTKIDDILLDFLQLLIDKNRFLILESVSKEYRNKINELNNLITITITSAIDLSDENKTDIKERLSEILKKNIEPEWNVNPDIIAGLIFEIGDNIIDNSLKHKLQDLRKYIMK